MPEPPPILNYSTSGRETGQVGVIPRAVAFVFSYKEALWYSVNMVTFELPQHIEDELRGELGDLSQAAKEAFLVQCYRDERLSAGQVAEILGRGVLETETWLAERGAMMNYSVDDFEADWKSLASKLRDEPQ
jgi:predicted HTH domain antitoxin